MLGHLTNINPISLKYWTLCLHMGPEWDYPVVNRPSDSPTKRNFLTVYFCCLVTLGFFFSILMCEMCLSTVYSTVEYGAQPKHDKTLSLCVNLILILHLYSSLYFFFIHPSIFLTCSVLGHGVSEVDLSCCRVKDRVHAISSNS